MKTYGRLGRSKWTRRDEETHCASFSEDEALSESFESEDCGDFITPKTSIDLTAEIRDSKAVNNPDQRQTLPNTLQPELLDFLDQPVLKKRKKTLHPKPYAIYEDADEPDCEVSQTFLSSQAEKSFQSTIDEANTMLSQLGESQMDPTKENAFAALEEPSEVWTATDLASKKLYGKTRTIVQNANDDDIDDDIGIVEALPESERTYLDDEIDGSQSQSTQHFNHLRDMGEALKYQDELEFFLHENSKTNSDTKIASLLGLALNMLNDTKMLDYAVKQSQLEIWEWCTGLCANSNDLILHVCSFILNAVAVNPKNIASGQINFHELVLPLLKQLSVVSTDACTDHVKNNYEEFLKLTDRKPGLFYGLKLWNLCLDKSKSTDDYNASDTILQALKNSQSYASDAFVIALKVLTKSTMHQKSRSEWLKALTPFCCSQATNQDLVKVLVRLTNDAFEICDGMADVLHCSLAFTLTNSALLLQHGQGDLIEVFVLHLGLCLNLAQIKSLVQIVPHSTVQRTYEVLQEILECSEQHSQQDFNQNMFVLICCYFACSGCLTFQPAENDQIQIRLQAFAEEIEPFNKSIHTNVRQVLDAISV
ncbi:Rad61p LALA0_S02e09384g [Lachancea lanzarotensis]|uniref:LALA0S02e09384g1_1 n=1 Tax=Lachancea lanzarotensis TaxID=1245769 RepID=A0A0C7MZY5_9SACH|nr:uncharacterized protein LALA0_S02e09384g [Lachancea lanzarotensis]CEP61217.1 LALA0S02e09384g1_1 [Lachancea lanzarotensis]